MTQDELKRRLYSLVSIYFADLKDAGNLVWGRTKAVNPNSPMVALHMGGITRTYRPVRLYVDGVPIDRWPSQTTLQVDLFTKGAANTNKKNVTAARVDTAANDMADFVNFLNSVHTDHWSLLNDISINVRQVQDLTSLINDTSWDYRSMVEIEIGFTQGAAGYAGVMYEGGIAFYPNGNPKHDAETGMPLYDNRQPMYDEEMHPLDSDGERLPEGVPAPLPMPEFDEEGRPIFPEAEQTSSGGRTQTLADDKTGWFEAVEIEQEKTKKEAPRYG